MICHFTNINLEVEHRCQQARRKQLQIGGAHIIFFKMTDLCNEQYSICTIKSLIFFIMKYGGGGGGGGGRICANYWGGMAPPCPPLFLRPCFHMSFYLHKSKKGTKVICHLLTLIEKRIISVICHFIYIKQE